MAKISRFATTRIAASLNADFRTDENVKDSFYLDGRIARKREKHSADISSAGEDRGFFYALFATHDLDVDAPDSETISILHRLTEAIKTGNDKIDNEINDLADCAVEVGGRATIAREGVRQSYFAGIIVKEAEIAAVTTGGACTLLYRNNAIYPLTDCDIDLVNADYHGNAIENMNDFSAGVAGTIRYSNIAQLQAGDALILCNKEVLEAIGQRELLKVLYSYDDGGDAAAEIIDRAREVNQDDSLQILIALVEEVLPADRTGKINLGLFQAQKDAADQATTRYEPIKTEPKKESLQAPVAEVSKAESDADDPFKPKRESADEPFTPSFMTTSAPDELEDTAVPVDYSGLEEQEVSQIETREEKSSDFEQDDDVPVFEPIVTSKYDQESDAFTAGREYADDDYYDDDSDDMYDDYDSEWQDDRAILKGNRNQAYDDDYYDDYDDYDARTSGGSKAKQYVLYIVLGVVCIACLVALYFMIFKKDDANKENETTPSAEITESGQGNEVTNTTAEADIRTPIKSESGTNDTTEPTDDTTIKAGSTIYVTVEVLNMRDAPNTEGELIATLAEGDALTVVEEVDGWYSVTLSDGTAGYVSADYVSATAP